MLISELEHLEVIGETQNIVGSKGSYAPLSVNLNNGMLSLSRGKEKLLQTSIEDIPSTGTSLSLEDGSNLLVSASSDNSGGIKRTSVAGTGVWQDGNQQLSLAFSSSSVATY